MMICRASAPLQFIFLIFLALGALCRVVTMIHLLLIKKASFIAAFAISHGFDLASLPSLWVIDFLSLKYRLQRAARPWMMLGYFRWKRNGVIGIKYRIIWLNHLFRAYAVPPYYTTNLLHYGMSIRLKWNTRSCVCRCSLFRAFLTMLRLLIPALHPWLY